MLHNSVLMRFTYIIQICIQNIHTHILIISLVLFHVIFSGYKGSSIKVFVIRALKISKWIHMFLSHVYTIVFHALENADIIKKDKT